MIVQFFDRATVAVQSITTAAFTNLSTTFAPVAPAFIFGFAVKDSVSWMGDGMSAAVGIAAALSLEGAGFGAFHIALEGEGWRYKVPAALYLLIGISALVFIKGGDAVLGVIMFGLVALAYSIDAMRRKVRKVSAQKEARDAAKLSAQSSQDELDRELMLLERKAEIELKVKKLAAQERVKLAEIEAKLSPTAVETFQKVPETFPTDWRKLTEAHKAQLAQMDAKEIEAVVGVNRKTAKNWLERLK